VPKLTILAIIVLCLVTIGFLMINHHVRLAHARPSVQRQETEMRLKRFAEAFQAYRTRHADWPDSLAILISEAHLGVGANIMPGAGAYYYRKPPVNYGDDTIIMWSRACHVGAHAGDPWGGEGQRAPVDIPAVGLILNAGLHVERLTQVQWSKRVPAPHPPALPGHPAD
jgi:hypothetical protein